MDVLGERVYFIHDNSYYCVVGLYDYYKGEIAPPCRLIAERWLFYFRCYGNSCIILLDEVLHVSFVNIDTRMKYRMLPLLLH